jgi:hypothetical protein
MGMLTLTNAGYQGNATMKMKHFQQEPKLSKLDVLILSTKTMKQYSNLIEAIDGLHKEGYTEDFNLKTTICGTDLGILHGKNG